MINKPLRLSAWMILALLAGLGAAWCATTQPITAAPDRNARDLLDKLKAKYGADYQYEIDDQLKLVFATNTDKATLDEIRQRLSQHAQALQSDLFANKLQEYVTVVVPKEWKGSGQGFFNPGEHSIIAKTAGPQLVHEFTHALHIADQQARGQNHQNWIIEGLATLFENSLIIDGHAVPQPNYRLKIIQNLVKGNHHKPWDEYVKYDQRQFMKQPGNHYSQARYMLFYLYEKKLLKTWYDNYVDGYAKDPTGAAAFEKTFNKPLAEIEKDWAAWLVTLPLPAEKPASQPAKP